MDYFQRQQQDFYQQEEERRHRRAMERIDEELNLSIAETSMWTTVWTSFFSWWS